MRELLLAYDLGTGGVKAAVFDREGRRAAQAFVAYDTAYPAPGHHEQALSDWWSAVVDATAELLGAPDVSGRDVVGLGVSGQSLAMVPLDAEGAPLLQQVPIWSDTRATAESAAFFETVDEDAWYRRTGNGFPAPLYTLFEVMWLREHRPDVFAATRHVVGSKDWLNHRLTGAIASDHSYASGTGTYDLRAGEHHDAFLDAAGLPRELFPRILASTDVVGGLAEGAAQALGLPPGTSVVAGGVDNSCMAAGSRNTVPGRVYASLGSSSWLTVCGTDPVVDTRLRPFVFAHVFPGLYNSAVSTFGSGSSALWVLDRFFGDLADAADPVEALVELAATSPPGARGLCFIPSLPGGTNYEGGPTTRGAFVGLDMRHDRADLARAVIEGIPLALRRPFDELRELTAIGEELLVAGGGARSSTWLQVYADVLDATLVTTSVENHAATLGAAALVAIGCGVWDTAQPLDAAHDITRVIQPDRARADRYRDNVLARSRLAADHAAELGRHAPGDPHTGTAT